MHIFVRTLHHVFCTGHKQYNMKTSRSPIRSSYTIAYITNINAAFGNSSELGPSGKPNQNSEFEMFGNVSPYL